MQLIRIVIVLMVSPTSVLRLELSNELIVYHTFDKSIRKINFMFGEFYLFLFFSI